MKTRYLIPLAVMGFVLASCQKDFNKFDRPEWLEGKLYTQLKTIADIDSFVVCVEQSGYDTIIDASGSYTIFAPKNEAFNRYLADNPSYNKVADIPLEILQEIVKIHIVQSPWSKPQLQTLDVTGWINKQDPNNDEPWGYKRQTLLKEPNKKYWITIALGNATIVDSTVGTEFRTVYNPSRKYLPIFFDDYMDIAEVSSNDFEFFFDRPYEPGNIYFGKAKLDKEDFFAENGFIYRIDEVVYPLKNAEQLLEEKVEGNDYSMYLDAIRKFPTFEENLEETNKQPGAELGLDVPTLYDLDYPDLVFDVQEELTGRGFAVNSRNTIRYHYGMLAPTNEAMQDLIDNVITDNSGYPHWPNFTLVPDNIKRIIANTHMSENPVYLSDLEHGFLNGEKDSIFVETNSVIEKHYGSNATFFGLDKAIVPRAFTSVSGPVYLRPGYITYMYAIEFSKILPAIKRRNANYSFFVVPDDILQIDSSLTITPDPVQPRRFNVTSFDQGARQFVRRSEFEMNLQMLNQVGSWVPKGIARKEFIPNLAGNYIVYNTEPITVTNPTHTVDYPGPTVSGGVDTKYGFNGDSSIGVVPVILEEPTDNGVTYAVNGWFTFTRTLLYFALQEYPSFFQLIQDAGLIDNIYQEFTFTTDSELYTVFVPSERTITNNRPLLDSMSTEELRQFIRYHFIPGSLVFTDGNASAGNYETMRVDETSTIYNTNFSTVDVQTGIDRIDLLDKDGGLIYRIDEEEGTSNIMTVVDISNDDNLTNYVTNGVLHEIDTILIKQ